MVSSLMCCGRGRSGPPACQPVLNHHHPSACSVPLAGDTVEGRHKGLALLGFIVEPGDQDRSCSQAACQAQHTRRGRARPTLVHWGRGRWPTPAGATCSLRDPAIRRGRRRTERPQPLCPQLSSPHFQQPYSEDPPPKRTVAQGRCPPPQSSHPADVPPGEGTGRDPGSHLQDLIGAEAGKHEGVPLHVQDGAGHQQMQIGAGEPCPQHLAVPEVGGGSLAKPPPAPPRSAPCPAHLPSTSPPAFQSICLSSPPQPSWRTSHSRRTSGKGNSLLNQMSSHRKQKQREPESWESGAGDSGRMGNALYQPQSRSNSQGT